MCEEESEDHEAVAKLFEINDSIHRTIERYKLFKKGDIEAANKIPKGTLGTSGAGVTKGADNTLNLIDFGDPEPAADQGASSSGPGQPGPTGSSLEDDLLGLSLGTSTYGQSGGIALGGSNGSGKSKVLMRCSLLIIRSTRLVWLLHPTDSISSSTSTSTSISNSSHISIELRSSWRLFESSTTTADLVSTAIVLLSQPATQPSRSTPDPFAALTSPGQIPRQASPFQFQQSVKSSAGTADLLGGGIASAPRPSSSLAQATTASHDDDDEWTFASAVPDTTKEITVSNTSVNIVFNISRESDTVLLIKSRISNNTPAPVTDLTLQVAVSKVVQILPKPRDLTDNLSGVSAQAGTAIKRQSFTKPKERHHSNDTSPRRPKRPRQQCKNEMESRLLGRRGKERRNGRDTQPWRLITPVL